MDIFSENIHLKNIENILDIESSYRLNEPSTNTHKHKKSSIETIICGIKNTMLKQINRITEEKLVNNGITIL